MVHVSSVRVTGCLPVDKQVKIEALQKALADVVYDKDLHSMCASLGQQVAIEPFYYGRSETDEHYNQCFDGKFNERIQNLMIQYWVGNHDKAKIDYSETMYRVLQDSFDMLQALNHMVYYHLLCNVTNKLCFDIDIFKDEYVTHNCESKG